MANTYTQLYIHGVFAVQYRTALLHPSWDETLRQYITGIVRNAGHKMIAINNVSDHMHFFVGLHTTQSIADMMRDVKGDSSAFINERGLTRRKFHWQEGYGAFSHSRSQLSSVANYIANQQQHHQKITFLDEYRKMLRDFDVDFDERYIFKEPE